MPHSGGMHGGGHVGGHMGHVGGHGGHMGGFAHGGHGFHGHGYAPWGGWYGGPWYVDPLWVVDQPYVDPSYIYVEPSAVTQEKTYNGPPSWLYVDLPMHSDSPSRFRAQVVFMKNGQQQGPVGMVAYKGDGQVFSATRRMFLNPGDTYGAKIINTAPAGVSIQPFEVQLTARPG